MSSPRLRFREIHENPNAQLAVNSTALRRPPPAFPDLLGLTDGFKGQTNKTFSKQTDLQTKSKKHIQKELAVSYSRSYTNYTCELRTQMTRKKAATSPRRCLIAKSLGFWLFSR